MTGLASSGLRLDVVRMAIDSTGRINEGGDDVLVLNVMGHMVIQLAPGADIRFMSGDSSLEIRSDRT